MGKHNKTNEKKLKNGLIWVSIALFLTAVVAVVAVVMSSILWSKSNELKEHVTGLYVKLHLLERALLYNNQTFDVLKGHLQELKTESKQLRSVVVDTDPDRRFVTEEDLRLHAARLQEKTGELLRNSTAEWEEASKRRELERRAGFEARLEGNLEEFLSQLKHLNKTTEDLKEASEQFVPKSEARGYVTLRDVESTLSEKRLVTEEQLEASVGGCVDHLENALKEKNFVASDAFERFSNGLRDSFAGREDLERVENDLRSDLSSSKSDVEALTSRYHRFVASAKANFTDRDHVREVVDRMESRLRLELSSKTDVAALERYVSRFVEESSNNDTNSSNNNRNNNNEVREAPEEIDASLLATRSEVEGLERRVRDKDEEIRSDLESLRHSFRLEMSNLVDKEAMEEAKRASELTTLAHKDELFQKIDRLDRKTEQVENSVRELAFVTAEELGQYLASYATKQYLNRALETRCPTKKP